MGRRRKKPIIVHTSWEPWGSFDCRGLEDYDIASQYYFQSIFSALDALWNTLTEAQKIWHQLQAVKYCWMANMLLWVSWCLHLSLIPGPLSCPEQGWMVSAPRWPWGPVGLTRVVSISVLEKGQNSFLKEEQILTGDLIVLPVKHSPALPGFAVLQQSEICSSECNE